jgi:hypothetical protein
MNGRGTPAPQRARLQSAPAQRNPAMMEYQLNTCRRTPPEDLRPGMFVVILGVTHELLAPGPFETPRIVRISCISCADGSPLRILSICLPFIQLEDADGDLRTLDIRRQSIGEVDEFYALEAFTRPASITRRYRDE